MMNDSDGTDRSDHGGTKAPRGPHEPGAPDSGRADLAVNGVIAAVGVTYASTHSLAATMVAGGVGLACAAVFAWRR